MRQQDQKKQVDGDPECARCHTAYSVKFGDEPTRFCHNCAHEVVEELLADRQDVKARFPWPEEFKRDKNGRFLGKSQKHWREQARRLYAECLVRASNVGGGVVGAMVARRILGIMEHEDPEMLEVTRDARDRSLAGMNLFVASFALTPAERRAAARKKTKKVTRK